MNIALIGGDARMAHIAARLHRRAVHVRCLGLPGMGDLAVPDLFSALTGAEALILPLPATRDGIYPTARPGEKVPRLSEIFSRAEDECLLLGGMLSPAVLTAAREYGVDIADYYQSETLLTKNARLTAEAAIGMAIEALPCSLAGVPAAVIGAGRIAKELISLLSAFRADTRVYARSARARAEAGAWEGSPRVFPIEEGRPLLLPREVRLIFCTAPARLFDCAAIAALSPGTVFFDLGGGGIDRAAGEAHGILMPPSAGLPGRCLPESAGDCLFDEICTLLYEKRGVTL